MKDRTEDLFEVAYYAIGGDDILGETVDRLWGIAYKEDVDILELMLSADEQGYIKKKLRY